MRKCMSKRVLALVMVGTLLSGNIVYGTELVKKDETVYVTLDSSGNVEERIVSDWLSAENKNSEIKDKSELTNIKNLKGNEEPKISNENITWKMEGKDIFYQGETNKKLPLDIKISYELDGKSIKPEKLIGKSGELKININYKNNEKHKITVKDKERVVNTPLTVATLTTLPVEKFTNVKVNGGKVINDGNNQIITFINMPGLKESLDLKDDMLKIPENLEITAKVEDFSMAPIMITATPKLLIDDIEGIKSVDELIDSIDKLQDASSKLAEGTETFSKKQAEFNSGFKTYNEGVSKFAVGVGEAIDGIGAAADNLGKLSAGTYKLSLGLQEFGSKVTEFTNGVEKIASSTDALIDGQNQVKGGIEQSLQGATTLKEKKALELQGLEQLNGSVEQLEKVAAALSQVPGNETMVAQLNGIIQGQKQGIASLKNGGNEFLGGLEKLEGGLSQTKLGSEKVLSGMSQLKEGSAALKNGGMQISEGSKALAAGASEISNGSIALKEGTSKLSGAKEALNEGQKQIVSGGKALQEGSEKLAQGAEEISKNMSKFHNEGIEKMKNEVNNKMGDLSEIIDVKDEIVKLSKNYGTFSGVGEDMEGEVKFVMKTPELKKEESKEKVEENKEEKKGFKNWIKDIFKKE
ncbi:MAG: hypothetical protein KID00_05510 [Clostridium argentinense]|uniref:X-X-X-Leu-X-X-Gly heptad repeats protein n=1 Tax=Clostridium faecium TaxID=2762223 RepID=A0ABR8YVH3_9CLOT|nr:hypothetical protein [Clostridium faecium]MBD8048245.1 hypothetical protein [Clostridium faecium]MBS5823307.1 hypothetical protein [Clostridium argentinense]MDU1349072.1 hypothetical protein [Clostridium argentinense]